MAAVGNHHAERRPWTARRRRRAGVLRQAAEAVHSR